MKVIQAPLIDPVTDKCASISNAFGMESNAQLGTLLDRSSLARWSSAAAFSAAGQMTQGPWIAAVSDWLRTYPDEWRVRTCQMASRTTAAESCCTCSSVNCGVAISNRPAITCVVKRVYYEEVHFATAVERVAASYQKVLKAHHSPVGSIVGQFETGGISFCLCALPESMRAWRAWDTSCWQCCSQPFYTVLLG
jgi:hypothetical protein